MSHTRKPGFLFALALMLSMLFFGSITVQAEVPTFLAKVKSTKSTSAKVTWKKVKGADRYVIYFHYCDGRELTKKVATVAGARSSYTQKKLSNKRAYKFRVVAEKKKGKKYQVIAESPDLHVMPAGNKKTTNAKSIAVKPASVTVEVGKTAKLKAAITKEKKALKLLGKTHGASIRWYSANDKIASVSSSGTVTGEKVGSCNVYAIALNGVWKKVKVTVVAPGKETPAAAKQYTVTYQYSENGEVPANAPALPETASYKEGDAVKAAAVPSVEGYEFTGWIGEVKKMPGQDVIVTGVWKKIPETTKAAEETKAPETTAAPETTETPKQFTVTYQYTGDIPKEAPALPDAVTCTVGDTVKAAAVPSALGYTFVGWIGEVSKMPANDVTVSGVWKANEYTLSYSLIGAPKSVKAPKSQKLRYGDKITAAEVTVPTGYTFDHWGNDIPEQMPAEDVQLTGTFTAKEYTLTIQYEGPSDASVPEDYKNGEVRTYQYGERITLPAPAVKGYRFMGWDKTPKTMPADNITVTGTWKKTYTLTYVLFHPSVLDNTYYSSGQYDKTLETKTQVFVEGEPQAMYRSTDFSSYVALDKETGHTRYRFLAFDGWYTTPNRKYAETETSSYRYFDESWKSQLEKWAQYCEEAQEKYWNDYNAAAEAKYQELIDSELSDEKKSEAWNAFYKEWEQKESELPKSDDPQIDFTTSIQADLTLYGWAFITGVQE